MNEARSEITSNERGGKRQCDENRTAAMSIQARMDAMKQRADRQEMLIERMAKDADARFKQSDAAQGRLESMLSALLVHAGVSTPAQQPQRPVEGDAAL